MRNIWRSASTSCKNQWSKLVDHVPIFWTHCCGLYLKVKLVTDQHAGNEAISHTSPCPSLLSTAASALAQRICSGKPVGTAKLQPFHPNSPRNGGNWHWSVAPWRHLCFFACQNTANKFQRRMIKSRLIPNMSFLGDVTCPIIFRSAKQVSCPHMQISLIGIPCTAPLMVASLEVISYLDFLTFSILKKNYFTSSDPHHDMSGGGCQVGVVRVNWKWYFPKSWQEPWRHPTHLFSGLLRALVVSCPPFSVAPGTSVCESKAQTCRRRNMPNHVRTPPGKHISINRHQTCQYTSWSKVKS